MNLHDHALYISWNEGPETSWKHRTAWNQWTKESSDVRTAMANLARVTCHQVLMRNQALYAPIHERKLEDRIKLVTCSRGTQDCEVSIQIVNQGGR